MEKEKKSYQPANGLAREDATARPGINVSSSISIPKRSKSRVAPKLNDFSSVSSSFLTSEKWNHNIIINAIIRNFH